MPRKSVEVSHCSNCRNIFGHLLTFPGAHSQHESKVDMLALGSNILVSHHTNDLHKCKHLGRYVGLT